MWGGSREEYIDPVLLEETANIGHVGGMSLMADLVNHPPRNSYNDQHYLMLRSCLPELFLNNRKDAFQAPVFEGRFLQRNGNAYVITHRYGKDIYFGDYSGRRLDYRFKIHTSTSVVDGMVKPFSVQFNVHTSRLEPIGEPLSFYCVPSGGTKYDTLMHLRFKPNSRIDMNPFNGDMMIISPGIIDIYPLQATNHFHCYAKGYDFAGVSCDVYQYYAEVDSWYNYKPDPDNL